VHAGVRPDADYGAVIPPLYLSSTYSFAGFAKPRRFDYSRSGNPTRQALEDALAALEGGVRGFAFATGMAAESCVLALLSAGDHLLVHDDLYGGTWRLITSVTARMGVEVGFADLRDPAALARALRPNTRMVWLESPTNPLMNLLDLEAVGRACRAHGALTVCDNTFLSPAFQRPLDLGIDIALHSTTKYINGHSDVVGGGVAVRDPALAERIGFLQNALGVPQSPHDCFLVMRGLKTLPLRMRAHHDNALELARWLERHPAVSAVLHPWLESHPQHALAKRQMRGAGGTFSFRLKDGETAARRLLTGVRLFTLAESLGGVESLIEHPWTMTHLSMDEAVRRRVGITEDLIRISVGIEDVEDLRADLAQALA
jgi:cystathionine gamma-lyase